MTDAGNIFFIPFELRLMEWLQAHLPDWSIGAISALSVFGEEMLLVLILGFVYWSWNKRMGKRLGLVLIAVQICTAMIKNVVLRLRPYIASDNIKLLRKIDADADIYDVAAQGYSFPSGHSANSTAVYGDIHRQVRKKWTLALAVALPLLVGFSRVAVGAHFPTDVLAGWALGLVLIFLVPFLESRIKNRFVFYLIFLLAGLPGFFFCRSSDYFSSCGMLLGCTLGIAFEGKFVNFENTRSPLRMILRVVFGVAVYFALNTLLKMPFSKDFLESGSFLSLLTRTLRYAVVAFVCFGVYPLLFKLTAGIGKKK